MPQFLSEKLDNRMYDLIKFVDELKEVLEEARHAENYEDFDDSMASAWERAQSMCSDIDDLRFDGSKLNSSEKKTKPCSGMLCH